MHSMILLYGVDEIKPIFFDKDRELIARIIVGCGITIWCLWIAFMLREYYETIKNRRLVAKEKEKRLV